VALTPKMKDRDMDAIQDKKLMQHLANLEKVTPPRPPLPQDRRRCAFQHSRCTSFVLHHQDNFGFTEEDAAQATAEEDGTPTRAFLVSARAVG
jgi:hypothetical protein